MKKTVLVTGGAANADRNGGLDLIMSGGPDWATMPIVFLRR
jgi:hypothetical protein